MDGTPLFEGQCSTKVLWSAMEVKLRDGGPFSSKNERNISMLEIPEAEDNKKKYICTNQQQKEDQRGSLSFVGCEGKHSDKG